MNNKIQEGMTRRPQDQVDYIQAVVTNEEATNWLRKLGEKAGNDERGIDFDQVCMLMATILESMHLGGIEVPTAKHVLAKWQESVEQRIDQEAAAAESEDQPVH